MYILIPADLFTRWGIDFFSPPGSVLPVFYVRGIDLLVPPDRFRGDRIPHDTCQYNVSIMVTMALGGLGGVVVIDAAIGAHGCGSRPAHYLTVAATLDKSLTSHCL